MESTSMKDQAEEALPKWPLLVMLFGAIFCLSCSAVFHLFIAHSERINNLLNRLDYAGISILIMGSCYPPNYYLFNCEMSKYFIFYFILLIYITIDYGIFYLILMTVSGIIVFIISIREEFNTKEYHSIRGILFLGFGISAGLPVLHLKLANILGNEVPIDFTLWYIGGIFYIMGGTLYTLKFPERFWPGKFCIIGNSHQIFHCFVLVGVFSHYIACVDSYTYRSIYKCSLR